MNIIHLKTKTIIITGDSLAKAVLNAINHQISLDNANLAGLNLIEADIDHACFDFACLIAADFSGSYMVGCSFKGANLEDVDFSGADLSHCDFSDANLKNACFNGAKLYNTDFSAAYLKGAQMRGIKR